MSNTFLKFGIVSFWFFSSLSAASIISDHGGKTGCISSFHVESIDTYGFSELKKERRGKYEFGLANDFGIAYTVLDPKDPLVQSLKDAYFNRLAFSICVEKKIAEEFLEAERCKTCSARYEAQEKIKLFYISFNAPIKEITLKDDSKSSAK